MDGTINEEKPPRARSMDILQPTEVKQVMHDKIGMPHARKEDSIWI